MTRRLLEAQRVRLVSAIHYSDPADICLRNRAQQMLARVRAALAATNASIEANAGWYGENGWAPAIRDTCEMLEKAGLIELAKVDAGAAKRMLVDYAATEAQTNRLRNLWARQSEAYFAAKFPAADKEVFA